MSEAAAAVLPVDATAATTATATATDALRTTEKKRFVQDPRLVDFLSGSAAGVSGKLIELPFDITKIRLQVQPVDQPRVFHGTLDVIRKTLREEGFLAFYKGGTSPILGAVAENAVLFVSYGQFIRMIAGSDPGRQATIPQCGVAGFLSGISVSLVLTPVEYVKCNLQIQRFSKMYSGPVDVMVRVLKEKGLRGIYKGHMATMCREGFGGFFWFAVYEMVTRKLSPDGRKDSLGPLGLMFSGSCAGIAFNASLFPADVLKSQMQTEEQSATRKSYATRFTELVRSEGIRGLYRGFGITMCRAVPANAAIFGTYELVSRLLTQKF